MTTEPLAVPKICCICQDDVVDNSFIQCDTRCHAICDSCFIRHVASIDRYRLHDKRGRVSCPADGWHGACYAEKDVALVYIRNREPHALARYMVQALPDDVAEKSRAWESKEEFIEAHVENLLHQSLQKCPTCNKLQDQTPDGCPAVRCLSCGQHFCWLCLTTTVNDNQNHKHVQTHGYGMYPSEKVRNRCVTALRYKAIHQYLKDRVPSKILWKVIFRACERDRSLNLFQMLYFDNLFTILRGTSQGILGILFWIVTVKQKYFITIPKKILLESSYSKPVIWFAQLMVKDKVAEVGMETMSKESLKILKQQTFEHHKMLAMEGIPFLLGTSLFGSLASSIAMDIVLFCYDSARYTVGWDPHLTLHQRFGKRFQKLVVNATTTVIGSFAGIYMEMIAGSLGAFVLPGLGSVFGSIGWTFRHLE